MAVSMLQGVIRPSQAPLTLLKHSSQEGGALGPIVKDCSTIRNIVLWFRATNFCHLHLRHKRHHMHSRP